MSRAPFTNVASTATLLLADDVDTDQIIPARFLKGTVKAGLGEHLFADRRADVALSPTVPSPSSVLVSGANFGCGSSREHAPWALVDRGFRVVIARSFGDIFFENATKNGLLPVALDEAGWEAVVEAVRTEPKTVIEVDLARQRVTLHMVAFSFALDPFAKDCLLRGVDELGYLLGHGPLITEYERRAAG